MEWGPLEPLVALVVPSRGVNDSDGDRTLTDATLALALNSDELTAAVRAASIAQLDAALRHEIFTVDRLPLTCLLLLSAKASKWEHATHQEEETTQGARMQLLLQISQLLYHLPVTVAMKEMKQISGVVTVYTRLAVEMQQSLKTICPLQRFLRRFYQHGQAVLTPVHAHFLYMCLHAKCYSAAMDILDETLVEIQAPAQVVTSVDFLGYAYYGGLLYLGEKRYQDALDFFQLAITAPAVSLSAFVIEAYKKLLLVTLILHGEAVVMPKYTPFVVTRNVENHCTAYVHLANAFVVDKDFAAMQEVVATNEELFVQDSNFGLVKQVVQAFKQRKLLQLTRTYATIELAKIATAAGMSNSDAVAAEKMLLTLISNGQMDAVIDKQKAMVRFVHENEDGGAYQDEVQGEASKRLQDEMKKLVVVASQLRVMDTELVTSVKFQSRLQKDKDRRSRIHMHNQQSDERLTVDTASGMDTLE